MFGFRGGHVQLKKLAKVTVTLGCLLIAGHAFAQAESFSPPGSTIPPTLFGLHIHRASTTTPWPSVPFSTWRLCETSTIWNWLEPKKGEWHFEALDKFVTLAELNKKDVILCLGITPSWASSRPAETAVWGPGTASVPKNLDDWRNYVRVVANRYKGRIRYYEIWNEPNLVMFYTGNVGQMVALSGEAYKVLKEVDPSAFVVSPSATGLGFSWTDEFLAKGGGRFADYIGYHFYVTPLQPEAMAESIIKLNSIMMKYNVASRQLWNTESGWFMQNHNSVVAANPAPGQINSKVLTDEEASAFLARAYIINWGLGVQRLIWYAWDDQEMGLTEADGKTVKISAAAYTRIHDWLVGARMVSLSSDNHAWTCHIERDHGYSAWIVWHQNGTTTFDIPKDWRVKSLSELTGKVRPFSIRETKVAIGISPLLLENVSR